MAKLGEFQYNNLFSGHFPVVTDTVTVGADLKRGTVLGVNNDIAVAVDSAAEDESSTPYAVLAEDAEDGTDATIYLTGEFNSKSLVFGGSDAVDDHKKALREIGIFVKENI